MNSELEQLHDALDETISRLSNAIEIVRRLEGDSAAEKRDI